MGAVHDRYNLIIDGLKQVKVNPSAAVEAIFDPLLYVKDHTGTWYGRVKATVRGIDSKCLENAYTLIGAEIQARRGGAKEPADERYEQALHEMLIANIGGDDYSIDPNPIINEVDDGAWMPVWLYVRADDANVGHAEETPDDIGACSNCGRNFSNESQVLPIKNITQRVSPGEEMPLGECPHCRALVYVFNNKES